MAKVEYDQENDAPFCTPHGFYRATLVRVKDFTKDSDAEFGANQTSVVWNFILLGPDEQDRLDAELDESAEENLGGHEITEWTVAGGPGTKGKTARYGSFCRALGIDPGDFDPSEDFDVTEGIECLLKIGQKKGYGETAGFQVNTVLEVVAEA